MSQWGNKTTGVVLIILGFLILTFYLFVWQALLFAMLLIFGGIAFIVYEIRKNKGYNKKFEYKFSPPAEIRHKFCPNCGAPKDASGTFCGECGTSFSNINV